MTKVCIVGNHEVDVASEFFIRTKLQGVGKESKMTVDFGELTPYLSSADMDLASIAAGFFEAEGLFRDETIALNDDLEVVLCQTGLKGKVMGQILNELLSFTLRQRPNIKTHTSKKECAHGSGKTGTSLQSICLFSGGIDSLSGILSLPKNLGPTAGAFVSHSGVVWSCVRHLQTEVLKEKKIQVHKVGIQRSHPGLQQMRGFTYLTMGAVLAKICGTDNIVISETGQTMFLPPLAALDEVTMTTHPILIAITKALLRESYGIKFNVFEPFSDLTKAEVVSLCDAKEAIPSTNSCFNSRFARQEYSHCGKCHGCLVRRIGCLVAGVNDAKYAKDVLAQPAGAAVMGGWPGRTVQAQDFGDLQALLRFSRDVLDDELDDTTRLKIATFSREDLYRRAALDVVAAAYLLYRGANQGRNPVVQRFFEECKTDRLISPDIAEARIAEVREQKRRPDFDRKL